MKNWYDVWVEAGARARTEPVFGSLAFALTVARSLSVSEQALVELSMSGDVPMVTFEAGGVPVAVAPLVLPVFAARLQPTSKWC